MLWMSLRMWSGPDISSCIIFDGPSESVVDTVLAVLEHHDGVGKAGVRKLQMEHPHQLAKEMALGREEARMEMESSANVTQAVLAFMMKEQAETSLENKFGDEKFEKVMKENDDTNDYKQETEDIEDEMHKYIGKLNLYTRPTLYEVEKVVDTVQEMGETEYFIQWAGFGQQDHTWEPEQNLGFAEKVGDVKQLWINSL